MNSLKIFIVLSSLILTPSIAQSQDDLAPKVKKAHSSGFCHLSGGPSYGITKKFDPFDTLEECFESGGTYPGNDKNVKEAYAKYLEDKGGERNVEEAEQVRSEIDKTDDWLKAHFGYGLSMVSLSEDYIEDLTIENNKISINESRGTKASVILEAHLFNQNINNFLRIPADDFAIGPFIAIEMMDTEGSSPLTSYGLGLMAGWRDSFRGEGTGMNIGFGYFIDSKAKILRNGLEDGDEVPEGITDPNKLTTITDVEGWMLMFSFDF